VHLKTGLLAVAVVFCPFVAAATQLAADPVRGETEYVRCQGCHALDRHRTGPRHCGLLGRKAGTDNGFTFTEAMTNSGIYWNQQTLDQFLTAPLQFIPGTAMGYAGIKQAKTRKDLIAYLVTANQDPAVCPP